MKNAIAFTAAFLLLVFSSAFAGSDQWYLFETPDYSILFPRKVETEHKQIDSEIGKLPLEITMYDASADLNDENLVYGFYTTVYPAALVSSSKTEILPKFFRGAIDGTVKNVNGQLLSEREISIDGFPGREIRVNYNDGQAMIVMRCYLVHSVMYIVQTITLSEKSGNASAMKFLNSFKLGRP